jgi:hypothetical protein
VDEVLLALKEINAKDKSIRSLREECETELVIPMEQALQTSGRLEGTRVPSVLECVEMQLALVKMEEVNETTEERSHRLEVEEVQEEMELREWNAIGAAGREGDG